MARRFTVKRLFFASLLLAIYGSIALIPYRVGDYYQVLDQYSGDISRGEITPARGDLGQLTYFYRLNDKLKFIRLDGTARKHLFKGAPFHLAAYGYISGDMGRTGELMEKEEGFWAYYIRANAHFRQAQKMTANALNLTDPEDRKNQLNKADQIAKDTKDDYLAAIKSDPNETNEPKWNYDIVTDDAARMAALMPKAGQTKVKLGVPGGGPGPGPEGRDKKGDKGYKPKDLGREGDKSPSNPEGRPKRVG